MQTLLEEKERKEKKASKTLPAKYLYAILHYHRNKQYSSLPLFLHIKGRQGTNRNFCGEVMMAGGSAEGRQLGFVSPQSPLLAR